ncbi:MAG: 50S ribosomal protein L21 [Planctomycetes bacterium]|jgi:large subunit ribosomal protein L21|nr:50S ribosomal protein L21 [Planctomycetota bacterium]MDP6425182.1 50S ribosomal protein L21 [Planctomycetota bacterium]
MYAIAEDRNQQVTLRPGDRVLLDYNESWEKGAEVTLDKVCLVGGDEPRIGTPYVDGASVTLEVEGDEQGKKLVIRKFKRRKNYRRKAGFRARYTRCIVKSINA